MLGNHRRPNSNNKQPLLNLRVYLGVHDLLGKLLDLTDRAGRPLLELNIVHDLVEVNSVIPADGLQRFGCPLLSACAWNAKRMLRPLLLLGN